MLISGALLGQPVDFTAPHVAKCADGVYGENWCTEWCNTDKWGCGTPSDPSKPVPIGTCGTTGFDFFAMGTCGELNTEALCNAAPAADKCKWTSEMKWRDENGNFRCDCTGCRGCGGSLKWVTLNGVLWDEFDYLTHLTPTGENIPNITDCSGTWDCTIENQLCSLTHGRGTWSQGYACQNVDAACWKSEDYKDGGCRSPTLTANINNAKAEASSPDCKWNDTIPQPKGMLPTEGWSACVGGSQSRRVTASFKPGEVGGGGCDEAEGTNDGVAWKTETQSC
jgi:hypothetical protein